MVSCYKLHKVILPIKFITYLLVVYARTHIDITKESRVEAPDNILG